MLYQRKVNRSMEWLKEKNKASNQLTEQTQEEAMNRKETVDNCTDEDGSKLESLVETNQVGDDDFKIPLEKNDRFAMILSALLVFLPFVLIIGAIGAILIFLITLL